MSLCAAAGEAGGCFVSSRPARRGPTGGPAADPERARAEAGRRARSRLRRYCVANRLNRMGTLTYRGAGCHDPRQARRDVGFFFRALREARGGKPFPYVWVPEWHATHGLHLHYAVGRYMPRKTIGQAWDHGIFDIRSFSGLPVGSGAFAEARVAAGYLSKYVAKTFDDDADDVRRPKGLHRFDVAQGFTPRITLLRAATRAEVLEQAAGAMGGPPDRFWTSAEVEDWQGPPAVWVQWRG